jgi:21S rRNA (GM2251-2'-O)-methyltransferase
LRCGKLYFDSLSRLPIPSDKTDDPSLWLVLDEVVDPQNLGALLRSAYFLGQQRVGILVCSKNSAPPTPVVSAASAGALEVLTVHSTTNLPRSLSQAKEDGFRIIGASSSINMDEDVLYDLHDLPTTATDDRPILLVLGSEGHGLRTLVAKACTEFVRIPAGAAAPDDEDSVAGVDSLNVSVTGGIMLWHLLNSGKR